MAKLIDILSHPVSRYLLEMVVLPLIGRKRQVISSKAATSTTPTSTASPATPATSATSEAEARPVGYLPKYFTQGEFQCKHCGRLPLTSMNPVLLYKLDQLRERVGAPIYVTSGYRCITHNAAVGGVSNSQHIYGNAADIYTDAMDASQLAELCKEIGFDGIGLYVQSDFVHVDVRDDGKSPNYYLW